MNKIVVVCQEEHEKGYEDYVGVCLLCEIERAVFAEREACAKVCEEIDIEYEGEDVLATWCASAIRARGQQ
jgi:hypothetical protein